MEKASKRSAEQILYEALSAPFSGEDPRRAPVLAQITDRFNVVLGPRRWGYDHKILRVSPAVRDQDKTFSLTVEAHLFVNCPGSKTPSSRTGIGWAEDRSYGVALEAALASAIAKAAAQFGVGPNTLTEAPPGRPAPAPRPVTRRTPSTLDHVSLAQVKHIHIMLKRLHWTEDEYRAFLAEHYHVSSSTDLTRTQRDDLIADFGKMYRAMDRTQKVS